MINKNCKMCNEPFTVDDDLLNPAFSEFAKTVTICGRDECSKKIREHRIEEERRKRYDRCLRKFPAIYQGAKLSDFSDNSKDHFRHGDKTRDIPSTIKSWIDSDYWCLFMKGEQDCGKTRLGFVCLSEMARMGIVDQTENTEYGFIDSIDLGMSLEAERFEGIRNRNRLFCSADILFIDDLGMEKDTQSTFIQRILHDREQNKKKTIITTNLNDELIQKRYGRRFYSRVHRGILNKWGIERR